MKRTLHTYGKNGALDIIGNESESVLFYRNKPIQYNWLFNGN